MGVAGGPQGQDASLFLTGGQKFCFSAESTSLPQWEAPHVAPAPHGADLPPVFHRVGGSLAAASAAGNAPLAQ